MNPIVVTTRIANDGSLHLDLPPGSADANAEVQVTVEPLASNPKRMLLACDLLRSDLIGIWADRTDIGDSRDFARRMRERAQARGRDS